MPSSAPRQLHHSATSRAAIQSMVRAGLASRMLGRRLRRFPKAWRRQWWRHKLGTQPPQRLIRHGSLNSPQLQTRPPQPWQVVNGFSAASSLGSRTVRRQRARQLRHTRLQLPWLLQLERSMRHWRLGPRESWLTRLPRVGPKQQPLARPQLQRGRGQRPWRHHCDIGRKERRRHWPACVRPKQSSRKPCSMPEAAPRLQPRQQVSVTMIASRQRLRQMPPRRRCRRVITFHCRRGAHPLTLTHAKEPRRTSSRERTRMRSRRRLKTPMATSASMEARKSLWQRAMEKGRRAMEKGSRRSMHQGRHRRTMLTTTTATRCRPSLRPFQQSSRRSRLRMQSPLANLTTLPLLP
mmetsp:Transcript_5779/g.14224  ORF Transcript_5779/g.14224 Transcript_5779/m.14224 type:complete len:351 (+) Transcript_5779:1174-2226(+)